MGFLDSLKKAASEAVKKSAMMEVKVPARKLAEKWDEVQKSSMRVELLRYENNNYDEPAFYAVYGASAEGVEVGLFRKPKKLKVKLKVYGPYHEKEGFNPEVEYIWEEDLKILELWGDEKVRLKVSLETERILKN